jgi:hypothetical protein
MSGQEESVAAPRLSKSEQLVADVLAAGGRLTFPDKTTRGGVNWRQRAYAARATARSPRASTCRCRAPKKVRHFAGRRRYRQRTRRKSSAGAVTSAQVSPRRARVSKPDQSARGLSQGPAANIADRPRACRGGRTPRLRSRLCGCARGFLWPLRVEAQPRRATSIHHPPPKRAHLGEGCRAARSL